jgi:putative phosphotransacetylase
MNKEELVAVVTEVVSKKLKENQIQNNDTDDVKKIPVGVSNRHVHLSHQDLQKLFGDKAELTVLKELSQPGQYASEQRVTLVGPKGTIEKVRVLGPVRNKTQVEISVSDCFKLGVKAPIRDSGDLKDSEGITVVGPSGSVTLKEGCIIAARHIHMHPDDARYFNVKDKDHVNVKTSGPRGMVFYEVLVRVSEKYKLEMHIDMDEANAACLRNGDFVEIV